MLDVQRLSGCLDLLCAGLLNVPFVQPGKAHRNPFSAETHPAFQFDFAAHMEGTGLREPCQESSDHLGVYAGTYQNFRAALGIPQTKKLLNSCKTCLAVATGATSSISAM